jgi:hypothetical protein
LRWTDARSRLVAVVSDSLLNPAGPLLDLLAERGWGVIQLPPAALGEADAALWLEALVDEVTEFRRHGYAVVALIDSSDRHAGALDDLPTLTVSPEARTEAAAFLAPYER